MQTVRTVLLAGALAVGALFAVLTWNALRAVHRATPEDMPPAVAAGKRATQKYLCTDCHTIRGNGARYAPDLTKSWNRFLDRSGGDEAAARSSMLAFLQHPPNATIDRRGMPDLKISAAEGRALVEFLKWTSEAALR